MNRLKLLIIATLLSLHSVSYAAIQTFSASGEYTMSDFDTPEIAEQRALDYAQRNAAEQAGIYIESYSRTENWNLAEDEIKTIINNNIQIKDKKINRTILSGGVIKIQADIKATIDTADIEKILSEKKDEREKAVKQYESLQKSKLEQDKKIYDLQKKIATLNDEFDNEISDEQERADREFLSTQKVEQANELNYNDYDGRKNFYDEAIKLNPKNDVAYHQYTNIINNNSNNAFKNDRKSLILNPISEYYSHFSLGLYLYLYEPSEDNEINLRKKKLKLILEKAMDLYPSESWFYEIRSHMYYNNDYAKNDYENLTKKYPKAIEDLIKAIELDPSPTSYFDGIATGGSIAISTLLLSDFNDWNTILKIYNNAISKNPVDILGLYYTRAQIYERMGDYDKAMSDYNSAVELAPNHEIIKSDRERLINRLDFIEKNSTHEWPPIATLDSENKLTVYTVNDQKDCIKFLLKHVNDGMFFIVTKEHLPDIYAALKHIENYFLMKGKSVPISLTPITRTDMKYNECTVFEAADKSNPNNWQAFRVTINYENLR